MVTVHTEHWTADGRRRSDVAVHLFDGTRLAFEVQRQPITDDAWLARHRDYVSGGIVDVWLWHPATGVPGICLGEPQSHWQLSDDLERIGIPIAAAHVAAAVDTTEDADRLLAQHFPPCSGDAVTFEWRSMTQMQAGCDGLGLPAELRARLDQAAAAAHQNQARHRQAQEEERAILSKGLKATGLPPDSCEAAAEPARSQDPVATEVHELHRIDGCPPGVAMELRRYRCQETCGFLDLGALTDGFHKLVEG